MRFKSQLIGVLFVLLFIFIGCSGNESPGTPSIMDQSQGIQSMDNPCSSVENNRFLWAYHEIILGPDDQDFEIVPVRHVTGHWNVLAWLEKSPCTNCFNITGITPTPKGTLQVSIQIMHPFGSASLTGFDVRGIAMSWGSHVFPVSGLMTSSRMNQEIELVNADGFTTLYNSTTIGSGPGGLQGYIQGKMGTIPYPNTTLNGYKRHITDNEWNTRNAFYAGTVNTQIYEVYKPAGSFILGYAVDASWEPPITSPVTDPMNDFPPEANCYEPWKIDAAVTPVGLGLTASGGEAVLTIDVYDYQGKMSHYAPIVECPDLFTGKKSASYKSSTSEYARFEVTIENVKLAPDGMYKCLISVEDVENAGSPDYLDLTAYQIQELGVGAQAPPNVEGFNASDADPDLPIRKIKLTWDVGSDQVEWYDIERLDFEWPDGWYWKQVKSAPHPETEWIDGNPRYCGTKNPVQYRISARNAAGSSPGYATDTGYPTQREFGVVMWCVADDEEGENPVVFWDRATADFNDCNAFWNPYGMNFVLQNSEGYLWVGDPQYRNCNEAKTAEMHEAYGQIQYPDSLNVYYIESSGGNTHKGYCHAICPGALHDTEHVFVILCRDTRGYPPNEVPIVLAHEFGHGIGHFWDVYLLDTNGNLILDDGTTCANTNTWCPQDPLFCDPAAAYAQDPDAESKNPWNLMWYSCPGKAIANYDLTDTQYVYLHNWVNLYKSNYPWP